MQKTSGASRLNALLNKGSRLVSFDVLKQLPRLSDQRLNLLPLFNRVFREAARHQNGVSTSAQIVTESSGANCATHAQDDMATHRCVGIPAASLVTMNAEGTLE
jgi:hypothetical protein